MIIKKPYAFLIKRFRLIHGILFAMLCYILIKSLSIYSFFNAYATENYFVNSVNLASKYVNFLMFAVTILAILVSMLIYFILSLKNKERKVYLFSCIYYIITFIYFLIMFSQFQKLEVNTFDIETVRLMRDISLLAILPQIVFIFIMFARTLGFNLKQFDFKKDLEELKIDKSDYEEIELTLGDNNYKYKRFFRKALRLTKYFILENKFLVTICSSVIVLIITLSIFLNLKVYSVTYQENQKLAAQSIWYTVENSYITTNDINGFEINPDKKYIIVKLKIDNQMANEYTINRNAFRLQVNKEKILPKFSESNNFMDIGDLFESFKIDAGETVTKVIVFEVDKTQKDLEYIFKIKNFSENSFGKIESEFKDILIKPINLDNYNEVTCQVGEEIKFNNTMLGNSTLKVKSFKIAKSFKEKYKYCVDEEEKKCYDDAISLINPISNGDKALIRLDSSLVIDENVYMSKNITKPSDLYKYYSKINYKVYGISKTEKVNMVNSKNKSNEYTYLEVPAEVLDATKIDLILSIRGTKYTIVLK